MDNILSILESLSDKKISVEDAASAIKNISLVNLTHTRIDLERRERTGVAEVVYGAGKTSEQIIDIASCLLKNGENVLVTRISESSANAFMQRFPQAKWNKPARIVYIGGHAGELSESSVGIVTAGTSDIPVAEEARQTLEFLGDKTKVFNDCGVAGIHRLMSVIDEIRQCRVVIAIAGMEGALASVLAGLVKSPVIAVPTSVGYGANFGGLAALLAMMNSCANGVSVVNIDNGFGAAYDAHLINSIR